MTSPVEVPCASCGHPVAMPPDVYADLCRLGGTPRHPHCGQVTPPKERPYTATVTIDRGPWGDDPGGTVDILATFTVTTLAPSLDAAMRGTLSDMLRDRWLKVAEKASIADLP